MAIDPLTLSAGLSAGSSLLGGLFGGDSADKAAEAQVAAAQAGIEEQGRQYDTTRRDLAPWRKTGRLAVNQLQFLLGLGEPSSYNPAVGRARKAVSDAEREYNALLAAAEAPATPGTERDGANYGENWDSGAVATPATPGGTVDAGALSAARGRLDAARNALQSAQSQDYDPGEGFGSLMRPFGLEDFETDPGYQFRLGQGQEAIENSAAARGMQLSGATMKGLNRFTQDFASNEYGNAWNRDSAEKNRAFNYLSGTSGQGLGAATSTASFGQAGANNISDLLTQQGNAQAAGIVGSGNAMQNALSGAGNSLSDYMMMKSILRR